jgi:hypothetical protein
MMSAMPALRAFGQDVAETPETPAPEATEAATATATAVTPASEVETEPVFEAFNLYYDTAFAQTPAYRRKSPFLAWFLSWVYPGIGQFYNGSTGKGITMTALATGGLACAFVAAANDDDDLGSIGALILVSASLWSMIDAPITAARINRRNAAAMTWNIGDGAQLKLRPAITYENPAKGLQLRRELHYGLSCRLEF